MKLTAIILSKGESSTQKAIESVEFADEILVILDSEAESALKNTSKLRVLRHELAGDYSQQRNFAATQAKGDWLLYLDSDEKLTDELVAEIKEVVYDRIPARNATHGVAGGPNTEYQITNNDYRIPNIYYIKRRDFFWGKQLRFGETKTAREKGFVRLVKKNSGHWEGFVHEVFISEHKPSSLNGYIDHFPHQTVSEFLQSINEYSSVRAKELKNNGEQFSTLKMIFYPFGKFVYTYFVKLGFLDGPAGFAYSFMMSFHSFLVRAKLLNL